MFVIVMTKTLCQISYSCHQHILSPTSVINIDVNQFESGPNNLKSRDHQFRNEIRVDRNQNGMQMRNVTASSNFVTGPKIITTCTFSNCSNLNFRPDSGEFRRVTSMLVTDQPFWSPTSTIFLHQRWAPTSQRCHQHRNSVTDIPKSPLQSPLQTVRIWIFGPASFQVFLIT